MPLKPREFDVNCQMGNPLPSQLSLPIKSSTCHSVCGMILEAEGRPEIPTRHKERLSGTSLRHFTEFYPVSRYELPTCLQSAWELHLTTGTDNGIEVDL
jgi:hypothetical protein